MNPERSERIEIPVLPLRDVVVYPHMVIPLFVGREKSIRCLEAAMDHDKKIMLVAQKEASTDEPGVNDLFTVGTVGVYFADAEAAGRHREGAGRRAAACSHFCAV